MRIIVLLVVSFFSLSLAAKPHWDPHLIPRQSAFSHKNYVTNEKIKSINYESKISVLRLQINWLPNESYHLSSASIEKSGTPALLARSTLKPKWGSYLGILKDKNGKHLYYDSIGTGKEYRKLTRAINLRFPIPRNNVIFELIAENPQSGVMETVFEQEIVISKLTTDDTHYPDLEVKQLLISQKPKALRINIYAEGYRPQDKERFWQDAIKTVNDLHSNNFPGVDYFSFYAVFHPSNKTLGKPIDLGLPIPEFDSFLGLYYPYWNGFERWYHAVYPTNEDKFRKALAAAPYDYALILTNHDGYWGVGNYMSHTAIPAGNKYYFTYLLLHEFGHFFGLNEEYEGGGRTELEFAPDIDEPWSQNMTFLSDPSYQGLKWHDLVSPQTTIPTPDSEWQINPPVYGAYKGGYGDSISTKGVNHKPGLDCTMEASASFCEICKRGIMDVILYSMGVKSCMQE
ncbi:IgA Peptidase M64 [Legionella busanensis]|uniref:IgA Peptidase M64 n=1 Tax=Legionella busanensis TaxID=190655 RepID=A0A378JNL6_9GAMM|nr:M64 family metallopeptidase [Legionella busanensis]STX51590.1 IgA Peptidase M64 [Legionella busanensis]